MTRRRVNTTTQQPSHQATKAKGNSTHWKTYVTLCITLYERHYNCTHISPMWHFYNLKLFSFMIAEELQATHRPGQVPSNYRHTWDSVGKEELSAGQQCKYDKIMHYTGLLIIKATLWWADWRVWLYVSFSLTTKKAMRRPNISTHCPRICPKSKRPKLTLPCAVM